MLIRVSDSSQAVPGRGEDQYDGRNADGHDEALFSHTADPSFFASDERPRHHGPEDHTGPVYPFHHSQTLPQPASSRRFEPSVRASDDPRLHTQSRKNSNRLAQRHLAMEEQRKMAQISEMEELQRQRRKGLANRNYGHPQTLNTYKNQYQGDGKEVEYAAAQVQNEPERVREELEEIRHREATLKRAEELDQLEALINTNPRAAISGMDLSRAKGDPNLLSEALRQVKHNIATGVSPIYVHSQHPHRHTEVRAPIKELDPATKRLMMDFVVASDEQQESWLSHIPSEEERRRFRDMAFSLAQSFTNQAAEKRYERSHAGRAHPNAVPIIMVDDVISPPPEQDTEPAAAAQQPLLQSRRESVKELEATSFAEARSRPEASAGVEQLVRHYAPGLPKTADPPRRTAVGHPGHEYVQQQDVDALLAKEAEEEAALEAERATIELAMTKLNLDSGNTEDRFANEQAVDENFGSAVNQGNLQTLSIKHRMPKPPEFVLARSPATNSATSESNFTSTPIIPTSTPNISQALGTHSPLRDAKTDR